MNQRIKDHRYPGPLQPQGLPQRGPVGKAQLKRQGLFLRPGPGQALGLLVTPALHAMLQGSQEAIGPLERRFVVRCQEPALRELGKRRWKGRGVRSRRSRPP